MSIDFAMRDWCDDTDFMLQRGCQEFPRLSCSYQNKSYKNKKPWGDVSDPVYTSYLNDENLMSCDQEKQYKKGVWYYASYPLTEHNDFAGLPSMVRFFYVFLGIEYRP